MTREEALKKIKELEAFIKECDSKEGFEDDEIFLLSEEEYEKYREVIPQVKQHWWLRSPGCTNLYATIVRRDGDVRDCIDYVFGGDCVRPVLRVNTDSRVALVTDDGKCRHFSIGDRIVKYGYTWIKISDDLAISEVPIGYEKFDDFSNDYETSYIRKWLKNWLGGRK